MNENFLKIKGTNVKSNLVNLSQLVFEVTDVCNLRCKYCGYGEFYEVSWIWGIKTRFKVPLGGFRGEKIR